MAEGTRYAKIEASVVELQRSSGDLHKTQGMMDDKLTTVESRLGNVEVTLHNMEEMLRRVIHGKAAETPTESRTQSVTEKNSANRLLSGKGLKVEIPRFNGVAAVEDASQLQVLEITPKIRLNALSGQFHPSTLRIMGRYGKKHVKIPVDNGSNNNFIKPSIAE